MKKGLLLLFSVFLFSATSVAQNANVEEINTFFAKTGAKPTYSKATGNINFLRFPVGREILISKSTPEEKALFFLEQNVNLFKQKKENDSFRIKQSKKDQYGLDHAVLQQYYKGVPVFSGKLKFHFNKKGDLSSLNGNFITIDKLNAIPTVSKAEAEKIAIKIVDSHKNERPDLQIIAKKSELIVFQKGLAQGKNGMKHLAYEIEVTNGSNIREFIFIDAHTKAKVEQFTGIHHALDRKLYNGNYDPSDPTTNLIWKEGDPLPGALDNWQQSEVETAGQMYYMMKNAFGHTSFNNLDAPMITVHNDPTINCPNANWNGVTANYCDGIASDDVIAHEWGHAYTEYTNDLIYAWQSGALNESYSDIWGETVDQLNSGYFDSGETNTPRTASCSDSDRWKLGESTTDGALRDMYNPNCDGISPGSVLDPLYWCSTQDAGGVHFNSGVQNHAYALLVDGGTYNSQTITGIGLLKAAHIFWYAQANYITRTTNFAEQADNLEDAALFLKTNMVNLYNLSTNNIPQSLSGIMITQFDLDQLSKVLLAVEMREENECNFAALLEPVPQICAGGTEANAIYFENFEDGLTGWTTTNSGGAGWVSHDWVADSTPPIGKTGTVAFAVNDNNGDCSPAFTGYLQIESPVITIPSNTLQPYSLAFDHYVSMEVGYDGGNIEYSINGGNYKLVTYNSFINNPYNVQLSTINAGNNNPSGGQLAFSGADGGSVSGSWGQSRINLTALGLVESTTDQTIQFRWKMSQDGCSGWDGWYIDDVRVYSCTIPTTAVKFYNSSTRVNEGEAITANISPNECLPYIEKTISVKINKAPTLPVTVNLNAISGTAKQGQTADFSITPSSVILESGTLNKDFKVRIYNDDYVESNETIILSYALSGGGDAFAGTTDQTHTINIVDDDLEPGVLSIDLINEKFENENYELPADWKVFEGDGTTLDVTAGVYPDSWSVVSSEGALDPTGNYFVIADSDFFTEFYNFRGWDKIFESPSFNTLGSSEISLSFLEYFRIYEDSFKETGKVEVWDGTTWHNLLTHTEAGGNIGTFASPFNRTITIPIEYSNVAMKIRFRYTASWDYGWIIDKVKVTKTLLTKVQSAVNTPNPAEAYLGPLETAVFYDPTTGDLIAKIKNLTTHDYGCTTVEIDRAGNGMIPWFGPYKISAKKYKVTPTTNNTTGEYEITFYFTTTEKTGITINSMGKTSLNGMGNNVSYASVQVGSVFNSDHSYKSTFNSGFSTFGLSDATPVNGPLPVKLISFEGMPTNEGNQLTWVTAEEKNFEAFVLERSDNAKDFTSIAKLKGKGNSKENINYGYLDDTHSEGINYYRLKQLDIDGKYSYSKTIALKSKNAFKISISPNPIISDLNIEVPFSDEEIVDFKIVSSTGAEMFSKQVKAKNGKITQEMNGFASGIYHVILKAKNKTSNYKIVKQ